VRIIIWPQLGEASEDTIIALSRKHRDHTNTSILTASTPSLDLDILDATVAEALECLVRNSFENRSGMILTRVGLAPKRALLFRTTKPFKKMREDFIAPDGTEHKIEFLCDGQQIVVDGIHPDTHQPYRFINGDIPPWDALVEITEADVRDLFESCRQFLTEDCGYTTKTHEPGKADTKTTQWSSFNELIDHDKLTAMAMKLARSGMDIRAAHNLLRTQIEAIEPHDAETAERKERRLKELKAIVDSGYAKAALLQGQEERERLD
jgi:hypothetical protein